MAVPNADEMEEFQRLSDKYQPDVEGPLIGPRLSMADLVTEYAQADPTFVAKTQALANTYEAYRRIKGDGQCGWRGTVFGYFETLLKSNDLSLILQERIRVQSFEDTMKMAGCDYDLLADMFEYTWELFDNIRRAVENGTTDENVIMDALNSTEKSDAIVYHFKMMTSSHMALFPDGYEPFLEMPLNDYRQSRIDPTNQEIDQIGLQALTSGVIAPGGIGVEVLYLDRSAGDEVTPHQFVDDGQIRPTIRLLYRPGHYDIVYKHGKPITVMLSTNSQSQYIGSEVQQNDINSGFYSHLFPESAYMDQSSSSYRNPASFNSGPYQNHGYRSMHDYTSQQYTKPPSYDSQSSSYATSQYPNMSQEYFPSISHPMTATSPHIPASSIPSSPVAHNATPGIEPQIRFNDNMYRPDYGRQRSLPLDPRNLNTFAQNQASFCSTDFQPEMWDAKNEYNK